MSSIDKIRKLIIFPCLLVAVFLMTFPIRMLFAEYYYGRVAAILDDPATDILDIAGISEETLPVYNQAIRLIEKSILLSASRAVYHKSLSEIYATVGSWSEAMERMGEQLPAESITKSEAYSRAATHLKIAISLEPTNPDYHLALGQLFSKMGESSAEKELDTAVAAYPGNAGIRYAVASQYLLSGNKAKAIEHAQKLAAIDDSYFIPDSPRKTLMVERRMPDYLLRLSRSYLFKALEIVWRAADKDLSIIKTSSPDSSDAHEVVRLFLEMKGIEE